MLRAKTRVLFVFQSLKDETPLIFSILGAGRGRAARAGLVRDLHQDGLDARRLRQECERGLSLRSLCVPVVTAPRLPLPSPCLPHRVPAWFLRVGCGRGCAAGQHTCTRSPSSSLLAPAHCSRSIFSNPSRRSRAGDHPRRRDNRNHQAGDSHRRLPP